MNKKLSPITFDPAVLGGKPCIRGLRISVADVIDRLLCGATEQEILDNYPSLTKEDVLSAAMLTLGSIAFYLRSTSGNPVRR